MMCAVTQVILLFAQVTIVLNHSVTESVTLICGSLNCYTFELVTSTFDSNFLNFHLDEKVNLTKYGRQHQPFATFTNDLTTI